LRRSTSNDVLSVKIGPTSASVDLQKNWKKCSKHSKNLGVYFGYMGAKPPGRIEPKFFWKKASAT